MHSGFQTFACIFWIYLSLFKEMLIVISFVNNNVHFFLLSRVVWLWTLYQTPTTSFIHYDLFLTCIDYTLQLVCIRTYTDSQVKWTKKNTPTGQIAKTLIASFEGTRRSLFLLGLDRFRLFFARIETTLSLNHFLYFTNTVSLNNFQIC